MTETEIYRAYLVEMKAMIEKNHDPRARNDSTAYRTNGLIAELYASVCQALSTGQKERP